jgi:hypothetical protein
MALYKCGTAEMRRQPRDEISAVVTAMVIVSDVVAITSNAAARWPETE